MGSTLTDLEEILCSTRKHIKSLKVMEGEFDCVSGLYQEMRSSGGEGY